jgi:hypothetical protein
MNNRIFFADVKMWQEGTVWGAGKKGDKECYSETKKKQSWGMLSKVRPQKGHLAPEVKVANEIACDYVWDKLYPPPTISVICSKWYIRKATFLCSQGSAFGLESAESLPAYLINLLPKSFGDPLSV